MKNLSKYLNPENLLHESKDNYLTYLITKCLQQPQVTQFKQTTFSEKRFTNFRKTVHSFKFENGVKYTHTFDSKCHLVSNLLLVFNASTECNLLKNVVITLKYGNHNLYNLTLEDMYNAYRTFPKLCNKMYDMTIKHNNYVFPLLELVGIDYLQVVKHSEFTSNNDFVRLTIESHKDIPCCYLSYDGFVLTDEEADRLINYSRDFPIYQYGFVDIPTNKKYQCDYHDGVIIDYILCISHKYMDIKLYDGEYTVQFSNANAIQSLFYEKCGSHYSTDKQIYYYDATTCTDKFGSIAGMLFPMKNKSLFASSQTESSVKCIFRYITNYDIIKGQSFRFQYTLKEIMFMEYINKLNKNENIDDIINEICELTDTYPLVKINNTHYVEGYWFSLDLLNEFYPIPIITNDKNDQVFLNKLHDIIFNDLLPMTQFAGFSTCRLCDKKNGSDEYVIEKNGIYITFPEGIFHYYDVHNVKPSTEFYNMIINWNS